MRLGDLLFWSALPLLAPQAFWVRQRAPRFDGAQGSPTGRAEPAVAVDVSARRLLGIGDSIIAGVGAREFEQGVVARAASRLAHALGAPVEWRAEGRIGADASEVIETLLPALPPEPQDVVLVSLGVNDCTGLVPLGRWKAGVLTLSHRLRSHSPKAQILFMGLPPLEGFPLLPWPLRTVLGSRAARLDEVLREAVGPLPGVFHVPVAFEPEPDKFCADGYHPNEASYDELAEGVVALILEQGSRREGEAADPG
jgi:lysophospholipase L1-like esterase